LTASGLAIVIAMAATFDVVLLSGRFRALANEVSEGVAGRAVRDHRDCEWLVPSLRVS